MGLLLGIDTGGTYTDAVVTTLAFEEILAQAKTPTTHGNLAVGIETVLEKIRGVDFTEVKLVSLSTTLATNTLVEEKGGPVGLLLLGYHARSVFDRDVLQSLPMTECCFLQGSHNVRGVETESLDKEAVQQAILSLQERVEAFAISGYFSVMNPAHELQVRAMIKAVSDRPVVCGHELTGQLNAISRAQTAALDARLLPYMQELITDISKVLYTRGIKAPLMITRGDGSLIGQALAQERPIETVLSGPAASVLGARVLSGIEDAIVIDMGGTTTDIAVLHEGSPVLNSAGALVGDWRTGIQTVELTTVGIGGDSHITRARNGSLYIGPRRAMPLCMAASRYPPLLAVLRRVVEREGRNLVVPRGDFLALGRSAFGYKLKHWEQELLSSLADGPRNVYDLASHLGLAHPLLLRAERLEMLGLVQRIGFTPTDALHASGVYCQWDVEAAKLGANILGKSLGLSEMELTHRVNEEVVNRIALAVLRHLLSYEIPRKQVPGGLFGDWVVRKSFSADADLVECRLRVRKKIVGVGAAAKAFLPAVADKLHAECVIPPYAEVANAVGTVAGNISQTAEALVRPQFLGSQLIGYLLTAPNGRQSFHSFEEAVERALALLEQLAVGRAREAGCTEVAVRVERDEVQSGEVKEASIRAIAMGRPHPSIAKEQHLTS